MSERALATTQKQSAALAAASHGGILQRKCACGNHTMAGGECAECKGKKRMLQRKSAVNEIAAGDAPPIVYDALRSPGQPLDPATRGFMESRFGFDFRQVRVHTDALATESARAVDALAYTAGRDVVFGVGQYSPKSNAGRQLIAHELAHVLQQSGVAISGRANSGRLRISDPNDHLEREADQLAVGAVSPAIISGRHGRVPFLQSGDGNTIQTKRARSSTPAASSTRGAPIVEDGHGVAAGQMHRSEFLTTLREALIRECGIEFAAVGRTAANCPYILRTIEHYATRPLSALTRVIQHFARPPAGADAQGLIRAVTQRARVAARNIAKKSDRKVQRKEESGRGDLPAHDPVTVRSQLGIGRPLDPPVRRRMEHSFDSNFAAVRVHDDGAAARFSRELGARAFAVGNDIAFGAGEYRPGTVIGDALIAHELAHTIQQGSRAPAASSLVEDQALEHEAERAALAAATGRQAVAAPQGAGGVRVQRLPAVVAGAVILAEATPEIVVAAEVGTELVVVDSAVVVAADVAAPAVVETLAPAAVETLAPAAVEATSVAGTSSALSTTAAVTSVGVAATSLSSDSPTDDKDEQDRRNCFEYNVGAIPCNESVGEDDATRDKIISDFLGRSGNNFNCSQFGGRIEAGAISDCGYAPALRYHCKAGPNTTVTIFACLCCDLKGNARLQWSRPHISDRG